MVKYCEKNGAVSSNFAAFSPLSCSRLVKRSFDSLGVMIGYWDDYTGGGKDRPPWSRVVVAAVAIYLVVMGGAMGGGMNTVRCHTY